MGKNTLNKASDILNPTEEQKTRMLHNILEKNKSERIEKITHAKHSKPVLKKLMPIAACLVLMLTITTIANAATGGAILDGIKRIFFVGGGDIELRDNNSIEVSEADIGWLVNESRGQLILSVNEENIDITDALKSDGYFYYDYRDDTEVLHRIYIVKNVGEDSAEQGYRWYSQYERLPENGFGYGKFCSARLSDAIVFAELDAMDGVADLETLLKQRLEKYWNEHEK